MTVDIGAECEYVLYPETQDPPQPKELCGDPTFPGETYCHSHVEE